MSDRVLFDSNLFLGCTKKNKQKHAETPPIQSPAKGAR